jgi:hypothetical protein
MNQTRRHLSGDLTALRYLDALNAGDLETVASLWEEATDDPQLERILAEVDESLFQEFSAKPSPLPERHARPNYRWAVWSLSAGTLAAACLLAILVWPGGDRESQAPSPPGRQIGREVTHGSPGNSSDKGPLLAVRRNFDEAATPGFVWPLENVLSASTPLDLLD